MLLSFYAYNDVTSYNLHEVRRYKDWSDVFFRQNQDRQIGPDETDALPHSASPTAADKDILVTVYCVSMKILHFSCAFFHNYLWL